jgi:hypothetical protein
MDEDGYPTELAHDRIVNWTDDSKSWFEFVKSLWTFVDWGWHESEERHEYLPDINVVKYKISTGGWSGNESLIRAMHKNVLLWQDTWVQSRRGGHYIFEIRL